MRRKYSASPPRRPCPPPHSSHWSRDRSRFLTGRDDLDIAFPADRVVELLNEPVERLQLVAVIVRPDGQLDRRRKGMPFPAYRRPRCRAAARPRAAPPKIWILCSCSFIFSPKLQSLVWRKNEVFRQAQHCPIVSYSATDESRCACRKNVFGRPRSDCTQRKWSGSRKTGDVPRFSQFHTVFSPERRFTGRLPPAVRRTLPYRQRARPPPPFSTRTIKAYGVSSSRRKPVNHAFGVLSAPTSAVPDFAQMSMPGKRS